MPGIDLVVVNYRTPDDLTAFCWSLFDNRPKVPWTLTVVNVCPQGADADVGDWAAKERDVRHRRFDTNVGYGVGCNAGGSTGAGDVVACFNADVQLRDGAVDECYEALVTHGDWGVLGPRQTNSAGLLTHAGIFGTLDAPHHRAWQQPDRPIYCDVQPAVTVAGSAIFVRRETWGQLSSCSLFRDVAPGVKGPFLPTAHYYEDTWVCYHAHAHHWEVMYFGPVCVQHEWHQASPVGGWAEEQFPVSQAYFRRACDDHEIAHD